ncbi:low affinity iron permease family protein [Pseudomonas sp. RIT-PI-AD]|uniref:low affinity iron permease family protein n=1 Tax=Pseudomonas sp. RIT-PI-AD TaxID=3035294 RepID=UPI0021D9A96B|nr:low affinity iron permease family protein [Pseudomonas sp. RIT-PI-AD]
MTFNQFAKNLSDWCGRARTFQLAIMAILIWAVTGPYFHFNDTWQLIINTSTTIITFLMVFLIQNTQNRDNDALHIKLDELLRVTKGAQDQLLNLEDLDGHQLKELRKQYAKLGEIARMECEGEERVSTPFNDYQQPERSEQKPS